MALVQLLSMYAALLLRTHFDAVQLRDEWSEVVLAAVRGLEELSALDAGRHVLAQPTCIALAFLRDILRQSLPSTSSGAAATAADSPQRNETGARRSEFAGGDGRVVVIAAAVLERMANDGSVSQALLHHRLDEPIAELLQRALEVEAQIRLRPAFNGKLAMLDNLTNLQVSFLLGSCSFRFRVSCLGRSRSISIYSEYLFFRFRVSCLGRSRAFSLCIFFRFWVSGLGRCYRPTL